MSYEVRSGSHPDFCPPVEEGITIQFEDEQGDILEVEFLGLLIVGSQTFGFFIPVDDASAQTNEVVILEVTEFDDEGNPVSFELVADEQTLVSVYDRFKEATKDIYSFE